MKAVAAIAMLMAGYSFCHEQERKDNSTLFTELSVLIATIITFVMM